MVWFAKLRVWTDPLLDFTEGAQPFRADDCSKNFFVKSLQMIRKFT